VGAVLLVLTCSTVGRFADAQVLVYDIQGNVDTTDHLRIKGSSVQWYHPGAGAAVGRHAGGNLPTIISSSLNGGAQMSGVNWTPTWPQNPPNEIRFEASSSLFESLIPALPAVEPLSVTATVASGRGSLSILDLPRAANEYTLVVQYTDGFNGPADLRGLITVTVPEPSALGLLGALVVFAGRRAVRGRTSKAGPCRDGR
jgi:hypothetical protein